MKTIDWRRAAALAVLTAGGLGAQVRAQAPATVGVASPSTGSNVYLAGGSVRPAGPVQGDFFAFGGRVMSDQPVKGDALLAGGSVEVRAPVAGTLRAAGGDVSIQGTVGGELLAAGDNVTLTPSTQVGRGAALAGGLVTIDGKIVGNIQVAARRIVLNGEVTGDARLIAEEIELGHSARIGGTLNHVSRVLKKADGAVIGSALSHDERVDNLREHEPDRHWQRQWQFSGPGWLGMYLGHLGLLVAGAVFLLLFPKFSVDAPEMIHRAPWLSLAIGFGVLVSVPVLAVLLFITLLGIPLGIAAFAMYPLLLVGYLAGVLFVAQRARLGLRKSSPPTFRNTIGFVALALLILMLISRLPVIGPLATFITTIAGIGACVLEWQRRRQVLPVDAA